MRKKNNCRDIDYTTDLKKKERKKEKKKQLRRECTKSRVFSLASLVLTFKEAFI